MRTDFPRCLTCKWWDAEFRPYDGYVDKELPDGWGQCLLAKSINNDRPEEQHTLAYAVDHEAYEAELMTHADFGCIQHEPAD